MLKIKYYLYCLTLLIICLFSPFNSFGQQQTKATLKRGDLIFQIEGKSEFSKAIADATAQSDSMRFCHVAIIDIDSIGNPYIIEASERKGVCVTDFNEFIMNSVMIEGKPGVIVKRLKEEFPVDEVIARALKHIGEPYDWAYYPNNGKMYCSELIYDSYLQSDGTHIFHSKPMNFKDKRGKYPHFWKKLFREMNMRIPQGVAGTNPNDMFFEKCLEEVVRFF